MRADNRPLHDDVQRHTPARSRLGKHRTQIDVDEIKFLRKAEIFDQRPKRWM
jgi:hypothetical protein